MRWLHKKTHTHLVNTHKEHTHLNRRKEQWLLWNKARKRERGYRKMPASTQAHAHTQNNTLAITHPHRRTYTHCVSHTHTHKQERNSNYLEMSPDIACHSQRPWSGFAHRTSYSAHTQTHTRSGREEGGQKKKKKKKKLRAMLEEKGEPGNICSLRCW